MNTIVDTVLRIAEIGSASYGALWYRDYLDKKKRGKVDDVSDDYARKKEILPILEDIRYETDASRVQEWVFSNGDTTLNGHHLKKLSIFAEVNDKGLDDIAHLFQFIPTKLFDRWLDSLHEAEDGHIISHESELHDELSSLWRSYEAGTVLLVKITNDIGQWVGLVTVCFEGATELTEGQIAFCKLLSARIGQIK